jgi:hypothetical protein
MKSIEVEKIDDLYDNRKLILDRDQTAKVNFKNDIKVNNMCFFNEYIGGDCKNIVFDSCTIDKIYLNSWDDFDSLKFVDCYIKDKIHAYTNEKIEFYGCYLPSNSKSFEVDINANTNKLRIESSTFYSYTDDYNNSCCHLKSDDTKIKNSTFKNFDKCIHFDGNNITISDTSFVDCDYILMFNTQSPNALLDDLDLLNVYNLFSKSQERLFDPTITIKNMSYLSIPHNYHCLF